MSDQADNSQSMNVQYEPKACSDLTSTAKTIVKMANELKTSVTAVFNGVTLVANPGDKFRNIVSYYKREAQRRNDEYLNSPEYTEAHAEAIRVKAAETALFDETMISTAAQMTVRDPSTWQKIIDTNNGDFYGRGIIEYAERWARIMEVKINNGAALADIADETRHIADSDGITGFMYGAAVQALATVWVHGEELRQWHNLKFQLGDEGTEANQNGSVLNPALLSIRPKENQ